MFFDAKCYISLDKTFWLFSGGIIFRGYIMVINQD